MADYLANIYGTEADKVNCTFFLKMGACRHGSKCERRHAIPSYSQTVILPQLYHPMKDDEEHEDINDFYEDVFTELSSKYGEIEEMAVCNNIGEHLRGNVYCQFRYEIDAGKAANDLSQRFYRGKPIYATLCPGSSIAEARCRMYESGTCNRGGYCNFVHAETPSDHLVSDLMRAQRAMFEKRRRQESDKPKSKTGEERDLDRDHERERDRNRDREHDHKRNHDDDSREKRRRRDDE